MSAEQVPGSTSQVKVAEVEETSTEIDASGRLGQLARRYRSGLFAVGGLIGGVVGGAIGGGLAVDRQYTQGYAEVAPTALATAVNTDKANDMQLLEGLNLPLDQDVERVRTALQGFRDLLEKDEVLRGKASDDFLAALESIDEYKKTDGLKETYVALREMMDTIPAAYGSLRTLLSAELDANDAYRAQMEEVDTALAQMMGDLTHLETLLDKLRQDGLGDFGPDDEEAFQAAVDNGMREQSWVYEVLNPKD